jgi:plastocyanin
MKLLRLLTMALMTAAWAWPQARISGQVTVHHLAGVKGDNAGVVVWLSGGDAAAAEPEAAGEKFRMAQRHQRFEPDLLVIPVGATVEFPNFDPYFHNVFSLGDNRPFDLGLYQAGSARTRRFTQAGVSYVFCNIHPRMSGVILTVPTRWYAVSDASGRLTLPEAPAGTYQLHVWYERARAPDLNALDRPVTLTAGENTLPAIVIDEVAVPATHLNKYGKAYDTTKAYGGGGEDRR